MHRSLRFLAALLMAASSAAAAQTITLSRPAVRVAHEFSSINGLRELPDGRLLVADGIDGVVLRIDPAKGTMDTLGRSGAGPGEYRSPDALFPAAAGGTLLVDLGNGRLSWFDAGGRYLESTPIAQGQIGAGPGALRLVIPRGTDSQGRIYYQPAGGGPAADSGGVIRWDRAASRFDTIARVKVPELITRTSGGPRNRNVSQTQAPFPVQDSWAVGADGRVALIRAPNYRVDWVGPDGRRTVGRSLPAARVPVRDADKREYLNEMASAGLAVSVENNNGQVRMSFARGRGADRDEEPDITSQPWPDAKPPVTGTAVVAPDGRVWVERSVPAGTPRIFDIVGPDGSAAGQVTLPPGRRLVTVTARGAYLRHVNEDGINFLERYDLR